MALLVPPGPSGNSELMQTGGAGRRRGAPFHFLTHFLLFILVSFPLLILFPILLDGLASSSLLFPHHTSPLQSVGSCISRQCPWALRVMGEPQREREEKEMAAGGLSLLPPFPKMQLKLEVRSFGRRIQRFPHCS